MKKGSDIIDETIVDEMHEITVPDDKFWNFRIQSASLGDTRLQKKIDFPVRNRYIPKSTIFFDSYRLHRNYFVRNASIIRIQFLNVKKHYRRILKVLILYVQVEYAEYLRKNTMKKWGTIIVRIPLRFGIPGFGRIFHLFEISILESAFAQLMTTSHSDQWYAQNCLAF